MNRTKLKGFIQWRNAGITAMMMCIIGLLSGGCMSYTVKGLRCTIPAGTPLDKRFTLSQLNVGIPAKFDNELFGCMHGFNDINLTPAGLGAVLCTERPDLFVKSNGIPFGAVVHINELDWPGDRAGTFAACILTLGIWPVTFEGHICGDAYIYAPAQANRTTVKAPVSMGYKCNLSVFSPIGLIPAVNGFSGYDGEGTSGCLPVPDLEKTRVVIMSEIARTVADALTTDVRTRLSMAAENSGNEKGKQGDSAEAPLSADDQSMCKALGMAEDTRRRAIAFGPFFLPARYVEPNLPINQLAVVTTKTNNIHIAFVDGAIVCDASEYSIDGIRNKNTSHPSTKIAPGIHELCFALWRGDDYIMMKTNLNMSAGQNYIAERILQGYNIGLSVHKPGTED